MACPRLCKVEFVRSDGGWVTAPRTGDRSAAVGAQRTAVLGIELLSVWEGRQGAVLVKW